MTEKRFEVYDDGFSKHIEDTYYTEDKHEHNLYDIWEMCRKLNELYEENQTLYLQNKRLKEKIQRERNSFRETRERWSNEAENKIKELSGENGQLKKEVEDLKQAVIRAAFGG